MSGGDPSEPRRASGSRAAPSIPDVIRVVAGLSGVTVAKLIGPRRTKPLVFYRQVGMWLARKLTPETLVEIGACFGGRDHSTVIHACRCVERHRDLRETADRIERVIVEEFMPQGRRQVMGRVKCRLQQTG